MTSQDKSTLKSYFEAADRPTATQFANLIDTIGTSTLVVAASNASNASKGRADYVCDGTDDQTEIQAAIAALPAAGGRVCVTEGTFNFKQGGSIEVPSMGVTYKYGILISTEGSITLEGIPGATIFNAANDLDNNLFMVLILGTSQASPRTSPTYVHGINFQGNDLVGECLRIRFAGKITLDHCRFAGAGFDDNTACCHFNWNSGISTITHNYFAGTRSLTFEGNNYIVSNNTFDAPGGAENEPMCWLAPDYDLIWATGTYYTHYCSVVSSNTFIGGGLQLNLNATRGVSIVGNTFSFQEGMNWAALLLKALPVSDSGGFDAIGNVIVGNTFTDCNIGIELKGETTKGCQGNIVALNTFNRGADDGNLVWGIREDGGGNANNIFCFNHFDSVISWAWPKLSTDGTNNTIYGNDGYITENKGIASGVADNGTIDHGLVSAPTYAQVQTSVIGEMASVIGLDATHITVGLRKYDGTTGTMQTIYWEASV